MVIVIIIILIIIINIIILLSNFGYPCSFKPLLALVLVSLDLHVVFYFLLNFKWYIKGAMGENKSLINYRVVSVFLL